MSHDDFSYANTHTRDTLHFYWIHMLNLDGIMLTNLKSYAIKSFDVFIIF